MGTQRSHRLGQSLWNRFRRIGAEGAEMDCWLAHYGGKRWAKIYASPAREGYPLHTIKQFPKAFG